MYKFSKIPPPLYPLFIGEWREGTGLEGGEIRGWEVRSGRKEKREREKGEERWEEGEGRKIKENREGGGKRGKCCAHEGYTKEGDKVWDGWRPKPPPPCPPLRMGVSYLFISQYRYFLLWFTEIYASCVKYNARTSEEKMFV